MNLARIFRLSISSAGSPRMLCFVERRMMGRLGADPSAPYVASRRTNQEKILWKSLAAIENRVEAEFLRPVLLGESILPYRVFQPFEAVVPVTDKGEVLDAEAAANRGFDDLHGWMKKAEKVWNANAESASMTLHGRWNYHNESGAQFPLTPLRVGYTKAGTNAAACVIRDTMQVIDHMLYWAAVQDEQEASFLAALFNSETTRLRVASLQSRGQWGARHFDKVMFNLPIPRFDANNPLHNDIAKTAREAEALAASVAPARKYKISTRARPCSRGADRRRRGAKDRRARGKTSRRRVSPFAVATPLSRVKAP